MERVPQDPGGGGHDGGKATGRTGVEPSVAGPACDTPRLIRFARDRGLEVHIWTINDADEMRALLRQGVDGIVTDYPDRMLDVLRERGSMAPDSLT